jgi:hypothetical protein
LTFVVNHDCSRCGAGSEDGGGGADVGVGFSFGAAAAERVTEDEITRTFLCTFTGKSALTLPYTLVWWAKPTT